MVDSYEIPHRVHRIRRLAWLTFGSLGVVGRCVTKRVSTKMAYKRGILYTFASLRVFQAVALNPSRLFLNL